MTTTYTTTSVASKIDAMPLTVYAWPTPEEPRGLVQISHGVSEEVALGGFGAAGWSGLVDDLLELGEQLRSDRPDLPLFLIGHSMGSFALQQAILDHSDLYTGVVLSGSTALDLLAAGMAQSGGSSGDLSVFNAGFEHRTGYEWLSRDEAEVDKYVADPLSGFTLDEATIPALFGAGTRLADPDALAGIRSDLPILLVSGDADPLAGGGQLVAVLGERYRAAGVTDVTVHLFPGARHEIFNETNRAEVTDYVIDWPGQRTPAA